MDTTLCCQNQGECWNSGMDPGAVNLEQVATMYRIVFLVRFGYFYKNVSFAECRLNRRTFFKWCTYNSWYRNLDPTATLLHVYEKEAILT